MMHDMHKSYAEINDGRVVVKNPQLRLSLRRDPLSFLLTLCDVIQGFDRPDAQFERQTGGPDIIEIEYLERCKQVRVEYDAGDRSLSICYKYTSSADYVLAQSKHQPEENLLYFDPALGYLDFESLGLSAIRLRAEK